jgi:hypothetical protein
MNLLKELYDAYEHSSEAETTLLETNQKLAECIEASVGDEEKIILLNAIESIMKHREQFFFKAGFYTARDLILK